MTAPATVVVSLRPATDADRPHLLAVYASTRAEELDQVAWPAGAREAFVASLKADPREPGTYTNLATLEMEGGNVLRARRYFAEALTIDPSSTAARQGLASTVSTR